MLYPRADQLLVLADNGGSNGSRARAWKIELQTRICDRFRISVTVCHYPPGPPSGTPSNTGCSARSVRTGPGVVRSSLSYETILNYIRSTKTSTGLRVNATLDARHYQTGIKINKADLAAVRIRPHRTLSAWNYTLSPAPASA